MALVADVSPLAELSDDDLVARFHGGDTDALDWRSDQHLLAILARGVKREREAREKDQFPQRRDGLGQPALRAHRRPRRPALTPAGAP